MSQSHPVLHMLCGKIASGKSTLAKDLKRRDNALMISEDDWLSTLFAGDLNSGTDYLRCTKKLRAAIAPHVVELLNAGVSVVLDFSANTVHQREWMRNLLAKTSAAHQLHVLDIPDEVCLARLRARNAEGNHPFAASDEQFHQFTKHFAPPAPQEGFTLVRHPYQPDR